MMAQALSQLPDPLHRFDVERRARLATTPSRSQNVLTDSSGIYSFRAQARNVPMVRWSPSPLAASWLEDALAQVDLVNQEAEMEEYPPIGELAKRNARHVLAVAGRSVIEPEVYPSMDGEIAIYFKSPAVVAGLLILLDNDGGAGCYWSVSGKSERHYYEDAAKLSPYFLSVLLRALGGSALSQSVE
jgi:hypothetical protein